MRIRHLIEYLAVRLALLLAGLFPRPFLLAVGRTFGRLWYHLDTNRRLLALGNLEIALGDRTSAEERREIALDAFRTFGQSAMDVLTLPSWTAADYRRRVRVEGLERIQSAYAEGRGVLLFSGHFGCWEIVPILQAILGMKLHVVVRPLDNPWLDRLLCRLRARTGNRIVPKDRAVREILRALKQGDGVAIVIDQNVRRRERVFVRFFGRPASTVSTLGVLGLRTGAAVIPVFCIPEPGGRYTIRYEQGIHLERTGNAERDAWEITQRATAAIEEYVRSFPEAWLWMHDRFRTKPEPDEKRPEDYEAGRPVAAPDTPEVLRSGFGSLRMGARGRVRARG